MRRSDISQVRDLPLFRDMSSTHFHSLIGAALLQKVPEKITLIHEGESPDFLHVLVDGSVELFAEWEDRRTTLDIIRPVTTFILAAVIRDAVYLKSARTIAPSQILLLPAEAVRKIFGEDAAFARSIVNELAERYRGVVRVLKDHKLRTGVERLANWILEEDRRQGETGTIALRFDKRILSNRLGMTPENLSRSFAAIESHGAESRGRQISITNKSALIGLAKPSALIESSASFENC